MVYQLVEAGRAFLEDLDLSAEVTADDQNVSTDLIHLSSANSGFLPSFLSLNRGPIPGEFFGQN